MANASNVLVALPPTSTPFTNAYILYTSVTTRKRRSQYIRDDIYLNDNKGNRLTEDGNVKKM